MVLRPHSLACITRAGGHNLNPPALGLHCHYPVCRMGPCIPRSHLDLGRPPQEKTIRATINTVSRKLTLTESDMAIFAERDLLSPTDNRWHSTGCCTFPTLKAQVAAHTFQSRDFCLGGQGSCQASFSGGPQGRALIDPASPGGSPSLYPQLTPPNHFEPMPARLVTLSLGNHSASHPEPAATVPHRKSPVFHLNVYSA
jgi:hypothetical protein